MRAVVDRFAQIEPAVLLAVDGYRYGGRDHDRGAAVAQIHVQVGGRLVRLGYLDGSGWQDGFLGSPDASLTFEAVPFEHPLKGAFQNEFLVHSREGEPCTVCGTPVRKFVVAGRGTYACESCQTGPLAAARGRRARSPLATGRSPPSRPS